jgi:hypothetical protein
MLAVKGIAMKVQFPQLRHSLQGRKPEPVNPRLVQIQLFKLLEKPQPAEPPVANRCPGQSQRPKLRHALQTGRRVAVQHSARQVERLEFRKSQHFRLQTGTVQVEDTQVSARLHEFQLIAEVACERRTVQLAQLIELANNAELLDT